MGMPFHWKTGAWPCVVKTRPLFSVYKNTKSTPRGNVPENFLGVGEEGVLERPKAGAVRIHEERLPGTDRIGSRPESPVEEGECLRLGQAGCGDELAQAHVVGLPGLPASGHVHHRNGRWWSLARAAAQVLEPARPPRQSLRFMARQPQRRRLEGQGRGLRLRLRTLARR